MDSSIGCAVSTITSSSGKPATRAATNSLASPSTLASNSRTGAGPVSAIHWVLGRSDECTLICSSIRKSTGAVLGSQCCPCSGHVDVDQAKQRNKVEPHSLHAHRNERLDFHGFGSAAAATCRAAGIAEAGA